METLNLTAFKINHNVFFFFSLFYRQSIDMYSSVTPPTIGFLGTPTLSRLGSSFITSSFQGKHTPEIISSLIKPLLPTRVDEQEQQKRQSSHSLLLPPPIPSRRPSLRKPKDDTKLSKVSHELPISRNCSFGQAVINGMFTISIIALFLFF